MDQEVNLSIKLGDLSLSSDISATFVVNGPDQVVTGKKTFENEISSKSGITSDGNIYTSQDITSLKNLYVGMDRGVKDGSLNDVACGVFGWSVSSYGGASNLANGHEHVFYGKESVALGNEGNIVGAKGFWWKAIDTDNHLIYLTHQQLSGFSELNRNLVPVENQTKIWRVKDEMESCMVPYFGPSAYLTSNISARYLLSDETEINLSATKLSVLSGQYITIWNVFKEEFTKCFKFKEFVGSSIIRYEDTPNASEEILRNDLKRTFYDDKKRTKYWTDNKYTLTFPDVDQREIKCGEGTYIPPASFGCVAAGDGNMVMGYNSFATGLQNKATQHNSVAMGSYNSAEGVDSIAMGSGAHAIHNKSFVWNGVPGIKHYYSHGRRTFNVNPRNGLSGFYIGEDDFIQCVLSAVSKMDETQLNTLKGLLSIS